MQKFGVITEVNNNDALVMVGKSEGCGNCGCSALIRKNGKLENDDHQYVRVKNSINGQVGDPVNIEFKSGKMLSTSVMLYFIPLVMLVVGVLIANHLQGENSNDLISFVAGLASLAVSYLILSRVDKAKSKEELITISEFRGF